MIAEKAVRLKRSVRATVDRPGNPQEQAFSDGYKSVTKGKKPTVYSGRNPEWFKAGQAAARSKGAKP